MRRRPQATDMRLTHQQLINYKTQKTIAELVRVKKIVSDPPDVFYRLVSNTQKHASH